MFRRYGVLMLMLGACLGAYAQQTKKVLFVGNSYTSVNNLPQLVADIAASMGDELDYKTSAYGGCTFKQHCSNPSMTLIRQGGWDAVVLQEQSQYPAFPDWQVEAEVYPYAARLVDSVYAHASCAEPIFYMTWGHKFGDQHNAEAFPPLATYEGMDSLLALRYAVMAASNDASLCPVGRVWHWIRDNYPDIELYQNDNSHPTVAGSYIAACAFYTLIFGRDPDSIAYQATLSPMVAQTIRSAVHHLVYDSLATLKRVPPTVAVVDDTTDTVLYLTDRFTVVAGDCDTLTIDWGDGSDTVVFQPDTLCLQHTYADTGSYTIGMVATRHCLQAACERQFVAVADSTEPVDPEGVGEALPTAVRMVPNPASSYVEVDFGQYTEWVELCDMHGRVLLRQPVRGNTCRLDTSHLPAGVYVMRTGGGISSRMVITR